MKHFSGMLCLSLFILCCSCTKPKEHLGNYTLRFANSYWETLYHINLNNALWQDSLSPQTYRDTLIEFGIHKLNITTKSGVIIHTTFNLTGNQENIVLTLDSLSNFKLQ